MKVSNSGPKSQSVSSSATDVVKSDVKTGKGGRSAAAEGLSAAIGSSSKVDVSSRAQELKKAKELASDSSVDEAKVARLQALIDKGQYKVDAGAIADRLVDEQLKMNE